LKKEAKTFGNLEHCQLGWNRQWVLACRADENAR
jgi:hypothetical protein